MRRVRALLIALLCLGFTPGLGELISDGLHLQIDGHTHHAEGHDEKGSQHGCSGIQHTCPCHTSLSIATVATGACPAGALLVALRRVPPVDDNGPAGVRAQLERPPRA